MLHVWPDATVSAYGVIYRSCINLTNGKGIEAPGGVGIPRGAAGALGNVTTAYVLSVSSSRPRKSR